MRKDLGRPRALDKVGERLFDERNEARAESKPLSLKLGRPLHGTGPVGPIGAYAECQRKPLVARSLVAVIRALKDDAGLGRGRGGRGRADGLLLTPAASAALSDARAAGDREVTRSRRMARLSTGVAADWKTKRSGRQTLPLFELGG